LMKTIINAYRLRERQKGSTQKRKRKVMTNSPGLQKRGKFAGGTGFHDNGNRRPDFLRYRGTQGGVGVGNTSKMPFGEEEKNEGSIPKKARVGAQSDVSPMPTGRTIG